jgi:hypothetical protein
MVQVRPAKSNSSARAPTTAPTRDAVSKEFKTPRVAAIVGAKLSNKRGDFGIGQSRVVLDRVDV